MKIALVQEFLVKLGGAERVLKTLSDMFPDAPIFTLFYDEEKVGSVFPKERIKGLPLQSLYKWTGKRQKFLLPFITTAIENLDFSDYDLVISSNTALIHGIITDIHTKHLCYCHSPARYIWDYYYAYKKERRITGIQNFLVSKLLGEERLWDKASVSRVDAWIANSKNVQKRIYKYFRKKSTLIYPPVDIDRFSLTKEHEDYFLIVSTLTSYKKIDLAIQLFNRLGRKLIIIGEGNQKAYLQSIAENNIEFLGYKQDDVVTEYMRYCRAFLFLGEDDFGITPVEVMACGKPVIAFGKGGALETVIPGITGELFQQQTVESLESGLARFFLHEKKYNPALIRKHSKQFEEKIFKKKILRSIHTLYRS